MVDSTDMSTPVTRGELREELKQLRQELKQELRQDLDTWGGALLARIQSGEQRLIERIAQSEQRLNAELARHAGALYESMSTLISASNEQYADLPGRVSRLETTVFAPKQG
jgi:hypothetical protein